MTEAARIAIAKARAAEDAAKVYRERLERELVGEAAPADRPAAELPAPVQRPERRRRGPTRVRQPRPDELGRVTPITQAMVAGDARKKGMVER